MVSLTPCEWGYRGQSISSDKEVMPKPPRPAASEGLRHNLLILVSLPSHIQSWNFGNPLVGEKKFRILLDTYVYSIVVHKVH